MKKTTIFEGAKFISAAVVKVQQGNIIKERMENEEARRKARAAREERMLGNDRSIFAEGREDRPCRKRVRNNFSTEEAGRLGGGTIIATIRNNKNHVTQVCRVSANRY